MADYTYLFNTPLSPQEEATFQKWLTQSGRQKDLMDYDARGWWKDSGGKVDARGHGTDKYKKPNHPTFSTESQYNGGGYAGGEWIKGKNGKWSYKASQTNLQFRSPQELNDYFRQVEPDSTLELPPSNITGR